MSFLILGFFTGLSLILAIGAQNIFVIEQGLKKQYVFFVCFICSISDLLLIFLGIFLFEYFRNFLTDDIELIFNILLLAFLIYFIITKIKIKHNEINIDFKKNTISLKNTVIKTLGFGSIVNVTLGLPFVRTSVDHGTAYDAAGSIEANESSLVEAAKLAATIAKS